MRLVVLPAVHSRTTETLSHSALSMAHLVARRADVALVFNAANAPLLPILRAARIPVAVHVDGLEWKRGKWGPTGRRYYLAAERLAVRWADALIADAVGIQDYYRERYGVPSRFIPYGAPLLDAPGAAPAARNRPGRRAATTSRWHGWSPRTTWTSSCGATWPAAASSRSWSSAPPPTRARTSTR